MSLIKRISLYLHHFNETTKWEQIEAVLRQTLQKASCNPPKVNCPDIRQHHNTLYY